MAGSVAASVALLFFVRRHPYSRYLKETNDVAGFYITIIGTLYSVILALMFFAVWDRYEKAEDQCTQEASRLIDVYQLADGMSEPYRTQVRTAARGYAEEVIQKEWPAMQTQRIDQINDNGLLHLITDINPPAAHDQALLAQVLGRVLDVEGDRRMRLHKADANIPDMLWIMLILGAVVTVAFSCLFGVDSFRLHLLKASVLAATIALVLFTIWAIDDPFQGDVRVKPEAFERAVKQMEQP